MMYPLLSLCLADWPDRVGADKNGIRLTPTQRDIHIIDADGDRVAANKTLMENFDLGTLDKADLEQTPFEFVTVFSVLKVRSINARSDRNNGSSKAFVGSAQQNGGRQDGRGACIDH
jgi:hypothetical protein